MPQGPLKRLLMGPDTVSRHKAIAELLSIEGGTLLDVGGNRGELALFTPGVEVVSINIDGEEADLTYDGNLLPFEAGSFDAVASLDVLEHIASPDRRHHIFELLRVTRSEVIVCCPLGSPSHIAAEREVAEEYFQLTGVRHRFLDEHLALGLPSQPDLMGIAEATGLDFEFLFQGDFRVVNELFLNGARLRVRPWTAARYIASRRRAGRGDELTSEPTEFSNRVFLKILKRADQ